MISAYFGMQKWSKGSKVVNWNAQYFSLFNKIRPNLKTKWKMRKLSQLQVRKCHQRVSACKNNPFMLHFSCLLSDTLWRRKNWMSNHSNSLRISTSPTGTDTHLKPFLFAKNYYFPLNKLKTVMGPMAWDLNRIHIAHPPLTPPPDSLNVSVHYIDG